MNCLDVLTCLSSFLRRVLFYKLFISVSIYLRFYSITTKLHCFTCFVKLFEKNFGILVFKKWLPRHRFGKMNSICVNLDDQNNSNFSTKKNEIQFFPLNFECSSFIWSSLDLNWRLFTVLKNFLILKFSIFLYFVQGTKLSVVVHKKKLTRKFESIAKSKNVHWFFTMVLVLC